MKKFLALLMTLLMAFSTLGGMACRGAGGSDSPEDLEIYVYTQGFGATWLEGVIEEFKKQDWVKEKYPKLTVDLEADSQGSKPLDKLANQKTNNTDLMFGQYGIDKVDRAYLTNLTEKVYLTEIPGQPGTLIMDRLPDQVKNVLTRPGYGTTTLEGVEYGNYYAGKHLYMIYNWMYNKTLFDQLAPQFGWELPVTTEEWHHICDDVQQTGYTYEFKGQNVLCKDPILTTAVDGGYTESQLEMWWTQYEGFEEYENFFNGIYEGRQTSEVLQQVGRYRALQQCEEMHQKYGYSNALATDAKTGQGLFLSGHSLFHYNGDYFTTEMQLTRDGLRAQGINYEIASFACPITSTLVERLSFYADAEGYPAKPEFDYAPFAGQTVPFSTLSQEKQDKYDKVLSTLIREIDAGKTWDNCSKEINGFAITEEDFNIVYGARTIKGRAYLGNEAFVVPSQTPAKELACDFIRFMYTDIAIEKFSVASKGLAMPTTYFEDIGDADYERVTSQFESEAINKFDMLFNRHADYATGWQILPQNENYDFGKAGLKTLDSYNGNMNQDFLSTETDRNTAKSIFVADCEWWQGDKWNILVNSVG